MLKIFADPEELSQFAARQFSNLAQEAVDRHGRFMVALTGGSSPRRLHQLLAGPPYQDQIPWQKVHIFWGDERYVPLTDDRSNAKMAFDTLLNHVDIPEHQIHLMTSALPPEVFARQYAQIIKDYFQGIPPVFDLMLLGMGDDGHTASIFPHEINLWDDKAICTLAKHPVSGQLRVSLTGETINNSAHIFFLVTGPNKAQKVDEIIHQKAGYKNYPAALVNPEKCIWLLDKDAATLI